MAKSKSRNGTGAAAQRSSARLAAVQALYQIGMSEKSSEQVLDEFLTYRLDEEIDGLKPEPADRELFAKLLRGADGESDDLDDMLAGVLDEGWVLERLERPLLSLLRVAIYELSASHDVPARVIINEYVDIAHAFFGGREPGMVNGLLDSLARSLRVEEFEEDGRQ